jgi:hypothetical protein
MIPLRYAPANLTRKDKRKQLNMLRKSRRLYKKQKYYTRGKVASFKNKTSNHILRAEKMYKVDKIYPNKELAAKTGCSIAALKQIVRKGEGAYYSSGSRPNQTPQSWGLARLASAITAGNASIVDYNIIDKGCKHNKRAFTLVKKRVYK